MKMEASTAASDREQVGSDAKALGAYYTDAQIAEFLVKWAIRSKFDRVMDPSFGGGVFLRAACEQIADLGGSPNRAVCGVEIDHGVHRRIGEKLAEEFGVKGSNLLNHDFFNVDSDELGKLDAVVGNPPFVRYQRFNGETRRRALSKAASNGVRLSNLSSSWAPFLVHAAAFLKTGGRLAFVVPMEVSYTSYSLPILEFLRQSFSDVTFLTFQKKLFPELSEDTLLLLAEGFGNGPAEFFTRDFHHPGMLRYQELSKNFQVYDRRKMDSDLLSRGTVRLTEHLLPISIQSFYRELKIGKVSERLGSFVDVGIGYVTGGNKYFHLSPHDVKLWKIAAKHLRPAVRRGRSLASLKFTDDDWESGLESGETCYLLHVDKQLRPDVRLRTYIKYGEDAGVADAYKCRTREPWYSVPHVHQPAAFLSYMSGDTPKLVANDTSAVAPNSLHVLRMSPGCKVTNGGLAALWQTSLTKLSCELEGHSLGGGMLKLEPTEAERVLLPQLNGSRFDLDELSLELDALTRRGRIDLVQTLADEEILMGGLGLTRNECRLLAEGARMLRARRQNRGLAR